jgi:GAF domain-containing protein
LLWTEQPFQVNKAPSVERAGQHRERFELPFASRLRESLEIRGSQLPFEFGRGDSLEDVLDRHLTTVERMADGELVTSILLLSADGKRLSHGAAPSLPDSYRTAIDGSEIGPVAGSCGTAAYLGRPIYVSDIATDPLWSDYRHLALPHGLRSCWSTPIRGDDGSILGTFAIYRRTVGGPTREEVEAINLISGHVARAIRWARTGQDLEPSAPAPDREAPPLKLVVDHEPVDDLEELLRQLRRLETLAAELDRRAGATGSATAAAEMKATARDCRELISVVLEQIERHC